MNGRTALSLVLLLGACDIDSRPEAQSGTAVPQVSPNPGEMASGAATPAVVEADAISAPAPVPPTAIGSAEADAAGEPAGPTLPADGAPGIRLRLLKVIDEASLQNTFFHRIQSIAVRDDGSMVVAHQGDRMLLWLDADGRLVRSMGERGSGPGEFGSATTLPPVLAALPEGAVAWDLGLRRLTFYSPAGEFQRTAALSSTGYFLGLSDDAEAVIGGFNRTEVLPREYVGVDLASGEITWRWTGPPAQTSPSIRFATGTLPTGRTTYTNWSLPDCVPDALAAAWQGRLFLVDASAGTVRSLAIGGLEDGLREEPIYRAQNRPLMNGVAEQYVLERIAGASPSERAAALERIVSEDGYLPVWKTLVVGSDGTLFLERTACMLPSDRPAQREWDVLTPEGDRLGLLTTPTSSFYIRAGSRDRIVAVVADALGVERIEVHALELPTP